MVKIIVSDMDGTLLNSNKELSPMFESVYKKLHEAGIIFVVASGRPAYALKPYFQHLNHDIIFIGDNGGFIGVKPEPVILQSFNPQDVKSIVATGRLAKDVHLILCGVNRVYIESKDEEFIAIASQYYININKVDDALTINDRILKVAVCDLKTWKKNSEAEWEKYKPHLNVAPSSDVWIDIMPKGVTKGEAVKYLQAQLDIPIDSTMVFGDFHNDIQMLERAKYSFAMANAHPDVKKVAQYEAPGNDENGVLNVIENMVLQNIEQ